MVVAPESDLPGESRVVRLVRDIPRFVPHGQPPLNGEAFVPSATDKDEARQRGCPVRVSVWDLSGISARAASAFRNLPGEKLWTLELSVQEISAVAKLFQLKRIRVVADPLEDSRPGADAHCGIEGLDRQPGELKKPLKAALDELARIAATAFIFGEAS